MKKKTPQQRLDEAAIEFTKMMERIGGGTVELNGKVIAEFPRECKNLTPYER